MLTSFGRAVCLFNQGSSLRVPYTPSLSCSLFHLRTPTRHCRSPFWGSLGGPGLSENPGSYLGGVAPTTLPAHRFPSLPPIPLSSRPEGLAGDEVTSPLKPHPASTPSLGIRKYDWGTSSPGAGAAQGVAGFCSVCPCPGKVQARGGARTSHRALRRKSRTWTSCITGWDGRSRGVRYHSGMPQRRIRVISEKSGTFSTGALELESKA